ncbi:MAG TPA: SDR family oxidoreductase [Gaiellaceae bacterium]|nr:SDR family oxidoreductase [Gaiellaceae bacterium]
MPSELEGVALVTGGGRGIGAGIARELAGAGMRVAVSARSRDQVEEVAREVGGLAVVADVSRREDVERMIAAVEAELGPVDVLVNNAGIADWERGPIWETEPERWWHTFEVNVLGVYLCSRAVAGGMAERGGGRIVNMASGAAYLPSSNPNAGTSYGPSKAAVHRFSELLATQLRPHGIFVFSMSPGLVRTAMTEGSFSDDAPWTPPELAPRLVRAFASGRLDKLAGRYVHAEHDQDLDDLERRADEVVDNDRNAIRLQR